MNQGSNLLYADATNNGCGMVAFVNIMFSWEDVLYFNVSPYTPPPSQSVTHECATSVTRSSLDLNKEYFIRVDCASIKGCTLILHEAEGWIITSI